MADDPAHDPPRAPALAPAPRAEAGADDAARAEARAASFRTGFEGRRLDGYRGLPVFAAPGLHEAAVALLRAALPPPARVLELGAGSGAMAQRLADLGYAPTASDLFPGRFQPHDPIPFVAADLNGPFAAGLPGDLEAVVALELVEHLENPRHFLRQVRALLPPGGQLLLSTPNIANPVSQAMFLRTGRFQWFRDADYAEQGHITPLSPWVLERALEEAGFAIRAERAVSSAFRRPKGGGLLARLLAPLFWLLSGLPRSRRGELWLVRAEAR